MPDFAYIARDLQGKRVTGTVAAANAREAVSLLSGQALFPVEVTEDQPIPAWSRGRRIGGQTMAVIYAQLSGLLRSGVPLLRSLQVLQTQTSNISLRQTLEDVHDRVEDGATLAEAMRHHPQAFNELAVSKVGSIKLLDLSAWRGKKFISRFWGDGLIVATPTGSTAYSLSAGGPLLHPSLEAVVLTPVCPHSLTERPMVLPTDPPLRIVVSQKQSPALATVDGREQKSLLVGDEVVVRRSKSKTQLVKLGEANHFETLRNKLNEYKDAGETFDF